MKTRTFSRRGVARAEGKTLGFFRLFSALVMGLYPNAWQGPLSTSLFWRWLGLTLALSLHGAVCTRYRVLGLAATLVLAVVPYLWLESRLARRGKTLAPL